MLRRSRRPTCCDSCARPGRGIASIIELVVILVLTRKSNQSIMIGDDIEITIVSVAGDKVRLGIDAPREIPVHRAEVYREIHAGLDDARESRQPHP